MALLPHWRWTKRIVQSPWIIIGPCLLYALIVLPNAATILNAFFPLTLETVRALIGTPLGTAAGWQHFLAFDLFVGRWIYLDSRANNITAWLIAPILYLTLMLGPLGFLAYLVLRTIWLITRGRKWKGILVSPVV